MTGTASIQCRAFHELVVRGHNSYESITLATSYSKTTIIPLNKKHIPTSATNNWSHLETIAGENKSNPLAIKTALGWCVVGKSKIASNLQEHV